MVEPKFLEICFVNSWLERYWHFWEKNFQLLPSTREALLKGKVQYSWPLCTNLFRSAPFYIENIIFILNETS